MGCLRRYLRHLGWRALNEMIERMVLTLFIKPHVAEAKTKNMLKLVVIFSFLTANAGFAQEHANFWAYLDSVLTKTTLVREINNDSVYSFMIFNQVHESDGFEAKGFLVENTIPHGSIDNNLPIPICPDSCNIRMEAYPFSDSLFIINYKWQGSENFVTDTCYLFRYEGRYMAFSKGNYTKETLKLTQPQWLYGPASTDEREVILICSKEARKTIFYLH